MGTIQYIEMAAVFLIEKPFLHLKSAKAYGLRLDKKEGGIRTPLPFFL